MIHPFLIFILAHVVVFIIWRLSKIKVPKHAYNPNGNIAETLKNCKKILKRYVPTPFLIGGTMQTLFTYVFKHEISDKTLKKNGIKKESKKYSLKDSTEILIELFTVENNTENIVFVYSDSDYQTNISSFVKSFTENKFSVVIAYGRGRKGAEYRTRKVSSFTDCDDLDFVIENYIKRDLHAKHVYLISSSFSACAAVEYCVEHGNVDACFIVSHPYDLFHFAAESESITKRPIFGKILLKDRIGNVTENELIPASVRNRVANVNLSPSAVDDILFSREECFPSVVEYYNACFLGTKLKSIKCKTLFLYSADDPFVDKESLHAEIFYQSQNAALILTQLGGHSGFWTGLFNIKSYAAEIAVDFFTHVL